MRKYFDDQGNPVPAAQATRSKGMQGGIGRALAIGLGLLLLIAAIALLAHA